MILDHKEFVTTTVNFTHGQMHISGTPIFVLAQLSRLEKNDGYVSTDHGQSLTAALDKAEQRRAAQD